MSSLESPEPPPFTDEDTFREYMEDLDLTPKDFDKKILDVGSGSGQFAKWAKEHGVSSEIYSVDRSADSNEHDKSVKGSVESMPYKDGAFDLVVSHAAIPQIFVGLEFKNIREEKIRESISEMLRVVKLSGEVRFGPTIVDSKDPWRQNFQNTLNSVLDELKTAQGIIVEKKSLGRRPDKFDKDSNPLDYKEVFLFKLKKTK